MLGICRIIREVLVQGVGPAGRRSHDLGERWEEGCRCPRVANSRCKLYRGSGGNGLDGGGPFEMVSKEFQTNNPTEIYNIPGQGGTLVAL